MGELETILHAPNLREIFFVVVAAFVAIQFLVKMWDFFRDRFEIETKSSRREKNQQEAISNMKSEIDYIKKDQDEIKGCLNGLQSSVAAMQAKQDKNEAARLKDRIAQAYRYHNARKEWTSMDKESLQDLIDSYSQYSKNSFVHSIVEPEMLTWRVIDQEIIKEE